MCPPILTSRTLSQIHEGLLLGSARAHTGLPVRGTLFYAEGGSFPFFPTRPAGLLPFSGTLIQIHEGDFFQFLRGGRLESGLLV